MKEKGFTLIELLAVILILGIIALIAIPVVNNIIEEAKTASVKDSALNIIKTAENSYVINMINGISEKKEYSCNGNKCILTKVNDLNYTGEEIKLDFKGTVPVSGLITISNDGKAHIKNLDIDNRICYEEKDEVVCKKKSDLNKLFYLDIPYKDDMTYYYDFSEFTNGKIKLDIVNASFKDDSIYFSGENKSYAYTDNNLGTHNYYTVYFVAKFDNVYNNNYLISTTSNNSSNEFGLGIGRYGYGTNSSNVVIDMVSKVSNNYHTEYDILNYYVYSIVYDGNNAKFYMNGNLIKTFDNCDSTSKFYFASYNNNGTIYGGSLIRYKSFSFVDGMHTDDEVKANSEWLYAKYLEN